MALDVADAGTHAGIESAAGSVLRGLEGAGIEIEGGLAKERPSGPAWIKRLGGDDIVTPSDRTPEQTEIALFWVESSPLQWNRIARDVAGRKGLDQWRTARLFALENMALADGYVASWSVKNTNQFWRPVTAIREADTDGNPRTTADPTKPVAPVTITCTMSPPER